MPTAKAPRESDLVKQCLDWLTLRRITAWRQNQGAIPDGKGGYRKFRGRKGVADILGILPKLADGRSGVFLAVETKSARGTLRPDQKTFLAAINDAGGLALVVRSLDELIFAVEEALGCAR